MNLIDKILQHKKKMKWTDRFLVSLMILGGILVIILFSYFFWQSFNQKSVDYFLPAESTAAYLEIEDLDLPIALEQITLLKPKALLAFGASYFDLPTDFIQNKELTSHLGLAGIRLDKKMELVFFARVKNRRRFIQALSTSESLTSEAIIQNKETDLYQYPLGQNHSFYFSGPYVFVSTSEDALKTIVNTSKEKAAPLFSEKDFSKSTSNLPRFSWLRGYINLTKVDLNFLNEYQPIIQPIQQFINQIAFTVKKSNSGLQFNSFTSTNSNNYAVSERDEKESSRFAYGLTDYIPEQGLALYIGGSNLSAEWQNTLKTVSRYNPAYGLILEGLVRAQFQQIFGKEVDLRNDFYPLIQNEYALVFAEDESSTENQPTVRLLLKHDNADFARAKLEKLKKGFEFLAAQFTPTLKIITLPDGTESREYIADNTQIEEVNDLYNSREISCVEIKNVIYGFCYIVTDQLIVVTNSIESIKETVDLTNESANNLAQSARFKKSIRHFSSVSDEITYIEPTSFVQFMKFSNPLALEVADVIESIGWIKHQFNDGMSSEAHLLFK